MIGTSKIRPVPLAALAVAAMVIAPPALAAPPSKAEGEGDMYQPWIPSNPDRGGKKPAKKPDRVGYSVAEPGSSSIQPAALAPGHGHAPDQLVEARTKARTVIAAASTPASPIPTVAGSGGEEPQNGGWDGPMVGLLALGLVGCAWVLRPRRD